MSSRESPSTETLSCRPTRVTRRGLLAASSVALAGCSSLGRSDGSYERSEIDLGIGYTVPDRDDPNDIVLSLEWDWAHENGGSEPDDAMVIGWPADQWELVSAGPLLRPHRSNPCERVTAVGTIDGMGGVRFRCDDTDSTDYKEYGGTVRCRLAPMTDSPRESAWTVYGKYAHLNGDAETAVDGWFEDLPVAWSAEMAAEF